LKPEQPKQVIQKGPLIVNNAKSIPTKTKHSRRVSSDFVQPEPAAAHKNEGCILTKVKRVFVQPSQDKPNLPPSPAFIEATKAAPSLNMKKQIGFSSDEFEIPDDTLFHGNAVHLLPSGLSKELVLVSSSQGSGDSGSVGMLVNSAHLSGSAGSQNFNAKGVTILAEKLSKRLPKQE
jgi:hypothetical protein